MRVRSTALLATLALALLAPAAGPARAADGAAAPGAGALAARFVKPGRDEKCPVCGMFVYKYPDWVAELVFADGGRAVFDGAKDLFRYLHDMRAFGGTRTPESVAAVFVTDYYSLEPVDGKGAWYVIGSDVYGPMGKELVPFARRADAEEFLRDHHGQKIVGFDAVGPELRGLLD